MTPAPKPVRVPRRLRPKCVALLSDFGTGPYVGQMRLLLAAARPSLSVIDLISNLVPFRPDLAAYLLPGLVRDLPARTLYVCVVDPGVGSERGVLAVRIGKDWFLAPDNGLLSVLVQRQRGAARAWRIHWRPCGMSATFHGRDLFIPLAVQISNGVLPGAVAIDPTEMQGADWPAAAAKVCYIDHYGNSLSGLVAAEIPADAVVHVAGASVRGARTFSDVVPGTAFWYENAFGLLEIAVNQGRADQTLGLRPGDPITFEP
jgi:S-adenosyl-L-methionine hydrolase (adenosine-forming)